MPASNKERARLGGLAAAANMTPEQRRERARRAHLASAVTAIVTRWPELTPEQKDRLAGVLAGGAA